MVSGWLKKDVVPALLCAAVALFSAEHAHAGSCGGVDISKERAKFNADKWTALDLDPRLDEARKSKPSEGCLKLLGELQKDVTAFVNASAARLSVQVESATAKGLAVKLNGAPVDRKFSAPGSWIKPGTYEVTVEVPPAENHMMIQVAVTLNNQKVEPKSEDAAKSLKVYELVLVEKQVAELRIRSSIMEAKCFKLTLEKQVPENVAEEDVQVTIHGASDSDVLETGSHLLYNADYALEVNLIGTAKDKAAGLLLNGKRLAKKTLPGDAVRYPLPTACTPDRGEEGTLVIKVGEPEEVAPQEAGSGTPLPTLFWVGTGVAVVGLGFGAYSYLGVASPAETDANKGFADNGCNAGSPKCNGAVRDQINANYDTSDKWRTVAIGSAVVGGAGAVLAGYFWFSSGTDVKLEATSPTSASVQILPVLALDRAGVLAVGRF